MCCGCRHFSLCKLWIGLQLGDSVKGYYSDKPSRPQDYIDSAKESLKVERKMKTPDDEYFELTDDTPITAFTNYLDSQGLDTNRESMTKIINETYPTLMALKNYYNRPRPAQVNSNIKPRKSSTAHTPAYPAGHAFQAYLIAEHLGKKYPTHYFKFQSIANRIADSRVKAGLHYPSDNRAARRMANNLI